MSDAFAWLVPAFGWTFRTGLEACGIALLVLLAQSLLGDRISARWRCNLWLLVVARLVLPAVPSRFSPFNATASVFGKSPHAQIAVAPATASAPSHAARTPQVTEPLSSSATPSSILLQSPAPPAPDPIDAPARMALAGSPQEAELDPSETVQGIVDAGEVPSSVEPTSELSQEEYAATSRPRQSQSPTFVAPRATETRESLIRRAEPVVTTATVARTAVWRSLDWRLIVACCWFIGVVVCLARLAVDAGVLSRKLRRMPVLHDPVVLGALAQAARLVGLRQIPDILVAPDDCPPALVGVWRPRLMLSRAVLSSLMPGELSLVMLHELVHLKRRDVLAKLDPGGGGGAALV
jgi:beta-lactamase regulating signal transducer with metallopeptidase domain